MSSPENLPSIPQQPQPQNALALRPSGALQTQLLAQQQEADAQADGEIDLKAILRTLLKHKWTIVGTTALCTLAAVVYTLRVTPQYESAALMQIDRTAQKVVGFSNEVEVDQGAASDQLQLRTQIELLKSRSLTERVIDEMGLYKPVAPGELPEAAAIAEELSMTPRVLRDRLQAQGLNLRDLQDEARRDAACWWLRHSDAGLAEVAQGCGFSEQSAFQRAFRRWTGQAPAQWREAAGR
ncbi:MAG TPA: Wzz/FepE/Etk N-terminal domain-containing protein [Solimonas sp.]|nr:Wzz/FepE/Etk N-terminal domain-containing protein [Solimonas sp.]